MYSYIWRQNNKLIFTSRLVPRQIPEKVKLRVNKIKQLKHDISL